MRGNEIVPSIRTRSVLSSCSFLWAVLNIYHSKDYKKKPKYIPRATRDSVGHNIALYKHANRKRARDTDNETEYGVFGQEERELNNPMTKRGDW